MELRPAVVVLNYEGLDDTLRCSASLRQQSATLIVVDNASRQDPGAIATQYPECVLLRRSVNGGWAGGNNTGISYALRAKCDPIILLNNDTIVSPLFVERLLLAVRTQHDYAVFGPLIHVLEQPDKLMTAGCWFNQADRPGFFTHHDVTARQAELPVVVETEIVNGCCLLVRAEVFRRIGLVDEKFFLVHEESDFCLRAWRAHFKSCIVAEPLVWHKGSSAFILTGKHLQRYFDARNLYRLLRKHPQPRRGRRGMGRSYWEYFKYVYYRYCLEREHGNDHAADGVLEGIYDALWGQYGPYVSSDRFGLRLLRTVFELQRRRRAAHG